MADTALFITKMRDQYSRVVARMQRRTDKFGNSITKTDRALGRYIDHQGRSTAANGRFVRTSGMATTAIGRQASWLQRAAVAYVAYKGAALAAGGVSAVFTRAMDTERMELMLDKMKQTRNQGRRTFRDISDLAVKFGLNVDVATESFAGFLQQGFTKNRGVELLKLGADMRSMGRTEDEVKGAFLAIRQIKSAGKLEGDELRQLSERNINVGFVYEELGKRLGKSVDEIKKMKRAGEIAASEAIPAIIAAANRSFGQSTAGESALDFVGKTMGGKVSQAKAWGQRFWIRWVDQAKPALAVGVGSAMDVFKNFGASGDGVKMFRQLNDAMRGFGRFMEKALPVAAEFATAVFGGLVEGITQTNRAWGDSGFTNENWLDAMKKFIPTARDMAREAGGFAVALFKIGQQVGVLVGKLSEWRWALVGIAAVWISPVSMYGLGAAVGMLGGALGGAATGAWALVAPFAAMAGTAALAAAPWLAMAAAISSVVYQVTRLSDVLGGPGIMGTLGKMWEMGTFDIAAANDSLLNDQARARASNGTGLGGAQLAAHRGGANVSNRNQVNVGGVEITVASGGDPEATGRAVKSQFEGSLSRLMSNYRLETAS